MKITSVLFIFFALFFSLNAPAAPPLASGELYVNGRIVKPQGILGPTFPEDLRDYISNEVEKWIQFSSQEDREIVKSAIDRVEIRVADPNHIDDSQFIKTPVFFDKISRSICLNGVGNYRFMNVYAAMQNRHGITIAYNSIAPGGNKRCHLETLMKDAVPARPIVKVIFPWIIREPWGKDWFE